MAASNPPHRSTRRRAGRWAGPLVLTALLGIGCSSVPFYLPFDLPFTGSSRPDGARSTEPAEPVDPDFSGDAAFGHLQALYALGPRPTGSEAVAAARGYLTALLEPMGAEVVPLKADLPIGPDGSDLNVAILTAEFEGASSDALLLVAPLDTAPVEGLAFAGANEGASGPAVLVELARVLTKEPLPYTLQLAFPDGDRLRPDRAYGSELLVATLQELDAMKKLRAVIYIDSVGDRDLHVDRDGNSNRRLRAAVFGAAPAVGQSEAFPATDDFATPFRGHMLFTRLGIPSLLLSDGVFGGDEAPGVHWRTEEDTPALSSPESLEAVGDVLTYAIRSQTGRWQRTDSMMASPVEPDEPAPAAVSAPEPEASEAEAAEAPAEAPVEAWEAPPAAPATLDPAPPEPRS